MKARIYCFGHGWALDIPGTTLYFTAFSAAVKKMDEIIGQYQIDACLDVYQARMGQIKTAGWA